MSLALQHPVVMSPGLLLEVGVPERRAALDRQVLLTLLVQHHATCSALYLSSSVTNTPLGEQRHIQNAINQGLIDKIYKIIYTYPSY